MRVSGLVKILALFALFLVTVATETQIGLEGNTQSFVDEPQKPRRPSRAVRQKIKEAEQKILQVGATNPKAIPLWEEILKMDPRNSNAHIHLGRIGLETHQYDVVKAVKLLEKTYDPKLVDRAIPMPSEYGMYLAMVLGRFNFEKRNYYGARRFITMANQAASAMNIADVCGDFQLATLLHPHPTSVQEADESILIYMHSAGKFIEKYQNMQHIDFDQEELSRRIMGFANDPYLHCALTIFHLSFYYRADVAEAARLKDRMTAIVWPQLTYQSSMQQKRVASTCRDAKIRLGIASGFMSVQSSVSADFGGVMQRLDRDKFQITYLNFQSVSRGTDTDPYVFANDEDEYVVLRKGPNDMNDGAWVTRFHPTIEELDLDILLYLDLTMNQEATRVAMARLARVQATSHGHPLTSGVQAVDYYISWGAAEIEGAESHYSEKLVLLNKTVPHQYYTKRHDEKTGQSIMTGVDYRPEARRDFFQSVPPEGNWYVCMQKPHKVVPEFDPMVCGVLEGDPNGRLILHQPDTTGHLRSYMQRLHEAGCDMHRVHFLPALPHHTLLALFAVSTLVLDSYPAGGCTTTREVLEMGRAIVTLPARLLGGRWSYAYYQMLGDDTLNQHVIATTPDDYVQKVVALGTDPKLLAEVESRILTSLPSLYERWDAVQSWEETLLRISPVTYQGDEPCNIANE